MIFFICKFTSTDTSSWRNASIQIARPNVHRTLMDQRLKVYHVNRRCTHTTHCSVDDASNMTAFCIVSATYIHLSFPLLGTALLNVDCFCQQRFFSSFVGQVVTSFRFFLQCVNKFKQFFISLSSSPHIFFTRFIQKKKNNKKCAYTLCVCCSRTNTFALAEYKSTGHQLHGEFYWRQNLIICTKNISNSSVTMQSLDFAFLFLHFFPSKFSYFLFRFIRLGFFHSFFYNPFFLFLLWFSFSHINDQNVVRFFRIWKPNIGPNRGYTT